MFCTKCGKQLDDGLKFCMACGAPVSVPEKKPDAEADAKPEVEAVVESVAVEPASTPEVEVTEVADETEASKPAAKGEAVAEETIGAEETAVMEPVEAADADAESAEEKKPFALPDSALEPSTPEPASETPSASASIDETAVMPAVAAAGGGSGGAGDSSGSGSSEMPPEPSPKKTRRKVAIGICSAAAAVIIAAIGVLVVLDPFNPNTPIDSDAFPNDVIRGAVLDQLDEDGDGRLSDEEAQLVTALVYTPDGAEFVTEGNEVDVQSIRESIQQRNPGSGDAGGSAGGEQEGSAPDGSAGGGQGQSGDGGADVQAQGQGGQEGDGGSDIGEELAIFPNIKTLVAPDCGLEAIDLSKLPELEYVDLRNNPDLHTFDLASNKKIQVLFCDEGTDITGLDEAGLYFTDLVTGMQVSGKSQTSTFQVEYDTHARPTAVTQTSGSASPTTTTYAYDDEGRLVREERQDKEWYGLFAYGENGLLSSATSFSPLGDLSPINAYAYGYDGTGNLTQLAEGTASGKTLDGATYDEAGAFSYLDGKLAAFKSTGYSALFAMDDEDKLVRAIRDYSTYQETVDILYAADGSFAKCNESQASLTGSASSRSYAMSYSDTGLPLKTTVVSGNSSDETAYTCNADGYVSQIAWSNDNEYMAGSTGTISYVKRVGSLSNRGAERYVPVIRPAVEIVPVITYGVWTPLQNWFASSGMSTDVTMTVLDPFDVACRQIGLPTYTVSNPNEEKLAAYDREHWVDGLSLGKEQPIEAAGVAELIAKAADTPLPVPAQTFLDDPVYGSVVKQYLAAMKQSAPPNGYFFDMDAIEKQYPDIPVDYLLQLPWGYSSGSGQYGTVDFSYVDLNQDGVNELVVCFPQYVNMNKGAPYGSTQIVVYGQVDGSLKLIANGGQVSSCWITNEGYIAFAKGEGEGESLLEKWNGTSLDIVGGFRFQASSGSGQDLMSVTPYGSDGKAEASYEVTMMRLYDIANEFRSSHPSMKYNWTPIPV